jgi:hypothetical protein
MDPSTAAVITLLVAYPAHPEVPEYVVLRIDTIEQVEKGHCPIRVRSGGTWIEGKGTFPCSVVTLRGGNQMSVVGTVMHVYNKVKEATKP